VPESAKTHNVETERKDPNSVLNFYRHLLNLRKTDAALREGKYIELNGSDPSVMSFLRQYKESAIIVVLNMSATKQQPSFDLAAQGLAGAQATALLQNGATPAQGAFKTVSLAPYGVYIAKLSK